MQVPDLALPTPGSDLGALGSRGVERAGVAAFRPGCDLRKLYWGESMLFTGTGWEICSALLVTAWVYHLRSQWSWGDSADQWIAFGAGAETCRGVKPRQQYPHPAEGNKNSAERWTLWKTTGVWYKAGCNGKVHAMLSFKKQEFTCDYLIWTF